MDTMPHCTACGSEHTYQDVSLVICAECAHESPLGEETMLHDEIKVVKDSNGNALADGDTISVIKDLKVKGSSTLVVKVGTKVKNIRLVEGDHNIDCRIEGIGPMKLKSVFVKKI